MAYTFPRAAGEGFDFLVVVPVIPGRYILAPMPITLWGVRLAL